MARTGAGSTVFDRLKGNGGYITGKRHRLGTQLGSPGAQAKPANPGLDPGDDPGSAAPAAADDEGPPDLNDPTDKVPATKQVQPALAEANFRKATGPASCGVCKFYQSPKACVNPAHEAPVAPDMVCDDFDPAPPPPGGPPPGMPPPGMPPGGGMMPPGGGGPPPPGMMGG
jgi:hypothetical protein